MIVDQYSNDKENTTSVRGYASSSDVASKDLDSGRDSPKFEYDQLGVDGWQEKQLDVGNQLQNHLAGEQAGHLKSLDVTDGFALTAQAQPVQHGFFSYLGRELQLLRAFCRRSDIILLFLSLGYSLHYFGYMPMQQILSTRYGSTGSTINA